MDRESAFPHLEDVDREASVVVEAEDDVVEARADDRKRDRSNKRSSSDSVSRGIRFRLTSRHKSQNPTAMAMMYMSP
jgi:hypothetical protein